MAPLSHSAAWAQGESKIRKEREVYNADRTCRSLWFMKVIIMVVFTFHEAP